MVLGLKECVPPKRRLSLRVSVRECSRYTNCSAMDPTTTGALRVALNVTEVSAVAEMERMRMNTERMMKAYHFQQTMCAYSRAVLTKVNANWDVGLMALDTYDQIGDGHYFGPQYKVNITFDEDYLSLDDDDDEVMAFVEPSLHPEESYLLLGGPTFHKYAHLEILPLADIETLANFLGDHPEVYRAFMDTTYNYMIRDRDEMYGTENEPSSGILHKYMNV